MPRWVTIFGSVQNRAPRPTQPKPAQAEWVPGVSWGRKHAYRVIHQNISVVSQCSLNAWLSGWLAEISVDLSNRQHIRGALRWCAIQINVLLHHFNGHFTGKLFKLFWILHPLGRSKNFSYPHVPPSFSLPTSIFLHHHIINICNKLLIFAWRNISFLCCKCC